MESKHGMSRRDFLRVTGIAASGVLLAACAPGADPAGTGATAGSGAAPASEGGTVRYWFGWGGNYAGTTWDTLQETDEFLDMIGDFTLETKGSSAGEVMLTAVAAGDPPDGGSNIQYLDYMARGVCLPVEDWVATSDVVKKDLYLEGTWTDAFHDGVMYGVPANEGFLRYALNYNQGMVEEAGLDPNDPPTTWEETLVWHEALTQFDDAGNMTQIGLDPYDAMGGNIKIQDGFFPAVSWGWTWFDPETGAFDLDNDNMVQAFELMGEFYKIAGPDNMAGMRQVEGQGTWGGSYNSKVQAMMVDGYWRPGGTSINAPDITHRASWAPVPTARDGVKVQGTGGHYVLFFNEAPQTEKMFEVSEFLNTNVAMDTIFENSGWLPGMVPYIDNVDPSVYPGLDFYFESVTEATEWSSPARCPITGFVNTQFAQLREAHYREELSSAEAAAEYQRRCEEEYKNAGFA
ncbi:MAG: substrate-binding domain-containing protein [Chloroflexota bacterium]